MAALLMPLLFACSAYDDSEIRRELNDHAERIADLELLCTQMNTNIQSMQSILAALEKNDYVLDVSPVTQDGREVGYAIKFAKSGTITIYHGTDGKDGADGKNGAAPKIGVKKDADGSYYWTLDGDWLLDDAGKKIKAEGNDGTDGKPGQNGKDGITPKLKIEEGYWFVSYDNGSSWTKLDKVAGDNNQNADSMFKEVRQDEGYLYLVLSDGSEIKVAKALPLSIVFESEGQVIAYAGASIDLKYEIKSSSENVSIEVTYTEGVSAKVVPETKTKGSLHVEIDSIKEGYSKVLVFVTDGVQVIMKSIYFEEEGLQIKDGSEIEVTHEGGTISLSYLSNVDCEVIIPEDVNWIHAISTKALEEKEMTFTVDPLRVGTRTAEIVVRSTTGSGYALTYKVIQKSDCYLELTSVETWYVELQAILPSGGKVVYMLADEKKTLTAPILAVTGINLQVQPNEIIRISKNVTPATHYYLYAMIKTDEGTWSDISEFEFTTKEAEYNGKLLSVVDTFYDGYHIGITAPHNGNAIRYSGMNKVQYNLLKNNYGDEFFMTPYILVANGGKFTLDNTTVIWDNSNIIEMDEYGNPVLDGNGNQIDIHDPITPGEPIVFLAGEFEWGTSNQMYDFFGWSFNEGGSGYYIPRFDRNTVDSSFDWGIVDRNDWYGSGWTGAFQKVVFTTKKPGVCDATVKIEIPEDEITSTGAMVYFDMDEEVSRYFYMVLDDAAYNEIIDVWFDMTGRPQTEIDETFQWFLTSWLAFYEWGTGPYTGDTQVNASAFFNNGWLAAGEEYHVLCTVMVDNNPGDGANQKYIHKTFKSKDFSKPAPVLEVTPVYEANGDDPAYTATFNIKVANKDVTGEVLGAYWACQASRDFEKAFDSGYTYESLLQGNYTLSSEEITQLNTPEGLTLSFPTLDGEVTRFAIYGANDEYNFNFIDPKTEGKGWADYRAPMASKVPQISGSVEIAVPVISEIVLTKGWIETRAMGATDCAPVPAEVKAVTMDGRPVTAMPEKRIYKSMTELMAEPRKEYKVDESPSVVTMEMVNATTEKILRRFDW